MIKCGQVYYAGLNEYHRWGKDAQNKVAEALIPNENGYLSIEANGGKWWTIGTSEGKFGEYAKFNNQFLSVNKGGFVYAKVGTPKEAVFRAMINDMLNKMKQDYYEWAHRGE